MRMKEVGLFVGQSSKLPCSFLGGGRTEVK